MIGIKRPDLVDSIVSIGANYNWDCGLELNDDVIEISEESKAKWRAMSPDPDHMQAEIIKKAMDVWKVEPNMTGEDLSQIEAPVLVLTGDDEPFSQHHTVDLYQSLPQGRLAILPGTSHAVMKERPELVSLMINDFYSRPEFPITRMPNLRKSKTDEILGKNLEVNS